MVHQVVTSSSLDSPVGIKSRQFMIFIQESSHLQKKLANMAESQVKSLAEIARWIILTDPKSSLRPPNKPLKTKAQSKYQLTTTLTSQPFTMSQVVQINVFPPTSQVLTSWTKTFWATVWTVWQWISQQPRSLINRGKPIILICCCRTLWVKFRLRARRTHQLLSTSIHRIWVISLDHWEWLDIRVWFQNHQIQF